MCLMANGSTINQVQNLADARVLVIGDLILDHYIKGTTERTSPEAPVPVVLWEGEEKIPGGAANVARNVTALGASAGCIGITGNDAAGADLKNALAATGVECSGFVTDATRPTTVKTRIVSHNQQMLRLDVEKTAQADAQVAKAVIEAFHQRLPQYNVVIVSDYAKGVLTADVLVHVINACRSAGVPCFVDPKGRDYARYHGAYALTPNAREAGDASGSAVTDEAGLQSAADQIQKQTDCEILIITRGGSGLAMFPRGDKPHFISATAREVFDVTGAGDTFVAVLAMGVAVGLSPHDAAELANKAAGVVVGKTGAATVEPHELAAALHPDSLGRKLIIESELAKLGDRLRGNKKRIVFTNGCFDFIHAGHIDFLQAARKLGDVLVLATNTDAVIALLKGAPRPIIKQEQRVKLLAAIEAVDYIVTFSEEKPHSLISALHPDVLVKGSNYSMAEVEGREIVEAYGGEVALLPVFEDISTRELLRKK